VRWEVPSIAYFVTTFHRVFELPELHVEVTNINPQHLNSDFSLISYSYSHVPVLKSPHLILTECIIALYFVIVIIIAIKPKNKIEF